MMGYNDGLSCQGDAKMIKYDSATGLLTGPFIPLGNITAFTPEAQTEKIDIVSRQKLTGGNAVDSRNSNQPFKITLKGNTFFKEIWELIFFATTTDNTGDTVTDEPTAATVIDDWVLLGKYEGFPGSTLDAVTDITGVTTYVLDTDYEYRIEDGAIKYLSTGAITLNDELLTDITKPTEGYEVNPGLDKSKACRIILDGVNNFNGRSVRLELWKVSTAPNASADFVVDENQEYGIDGTCEIPSGFTTPFKVHYVD